MVALRLHGSRVDTVFDLLGRNENDMTFALGWGLSRSRAVLRRFVERVAPGAELEPPVVVELQEHDRADGGFTDIELLSADLHVIVEAKRGWDPPSDAQLLRYEPHLARADRPAQRVVILTHNGGEAVVRHQVGPRQPVPSAAVEVLGWSDVADSSAPPAAAVLLPSATWPPSSPPTYEGSPTCGTSRARACTSCRCRRLPSPGGRSRRSTSSRSSGGTSSPGTGKNWTQTPPNYVAFRYYGRLQSIHHVDECAIAQEMRPYFPGAPDTSAWEPHFLTTLGPAIPPDHEVRTGKGSSAPRVSGPTSTYC